MANSPDIDTTIKHDEAHRPANNSPRWTRILFQVFCLAWLIPILYMLIRNFKTWIIGASSWCPDHNCWADLFDLQLSRIWTTARRLDTQSHDLNGALQFVAKALEVWFIIIASSFVYLYTMLLAGKAEGLPVRYLTWPSEFSDITSIFSRSLWTAAYSKQNKADDVQNQRSGFLGRTKQCLSWPPLFVTITVLLCILCALMGPSVAVLIIPSLQWIPTASIGDHTFHEVTSTSPPDAKGLLATIQNQYLNDKDVCTQSELAAGNYSCSVSALGWTLDALVGNFLEYFETDSLSPNFGLIGERGVSSWIYNATNEHFFRKTSFWTPNRQVLRQIGYDRFVIEFTGQHSHVHLLNTNVSDYESYKIFNHSLEMRVQRNGPMIGARPNLWPLNPASSTWTTRVDSTRSIRCYESYSILWNDIPGSEYTRCIRLGTGWNAANKQVNFSISGATEPLSGKSISGVNFTASFSDKVSFLANNNLPSWLPSGCLSNKTNGNVPSDLTCDWDRFFAIQIPELSNRTTYSNTWDLFYPNDTSTPFWSIDFNAYVGFGLYQLDPSPAVNPSNLVQTLNVPSTGPPIVIDPHWAALAWSANVDGVIPANRTTPLQFIRNLSENQGISNVVAILAILNMLTQLPFSTLPRSAGQLDAQHPLLQRNGTIYVYAYRVSGKTSIFSVVVVIIGIVVVLAHAVLAFWYRPHKTIKEVVIAALEHNPQGEFTHAATGHEAVKTRFQVEHTDQGVGELIFRKQH